MKNKSACLAVTGLLATTLLSACGDNSGGTVAEGCDPAHEFDTLKKGTLTVATYELPPYSKVEGNDITGVDGDILNQIAKMECLTIKPMNLSAAAVIPSVQAGRADLAAGNWYRTEDRSKVVALSDPVYTDQMALISEDGVTDITQLKSRKVGTVDGFLWVADMKDYIGSALKIYPSPVNMYQDLKAGRIDVAVDGFGSAAYNAGDEFEVKAAEPLEAIGASLDPAQSSFPVPLGKDALLDALNDDIAKLRESGELAKILENHDLDPSAAEPGDPRLLK